MRKVLVLKTSILGDESASNRLVQEFLRHWEEHHPGDEITLRDLSVDIMPHLSGETFAAWMVPEAERDAAQRSAVELSDEVTHEFLENDVVVIGLPMYNLSVPSSFKAYIDHIVRAGYTFRYTEEGSEGLAGDKQVYVLGARGGVYWDSPADMQTPYINGIMELMGIENVQYVVAEGLAIDEATAEESMTRALADIREVLAQG